MINYTKRTLFLTVGVGFAAFSIYASSTLTYGLTIGIAAILLTSLVFTFELFKYLLPVYAQWTDSDNMKLSMYVFYTLLTVMSVLFFAHYLESLHNENNISVVLQKTYKAEHYRELTDFDKNIVVYEKDVSDKSKYERGDAAKEAIKALDIIRIQRKELKQQLDATYNPGQKKNRLWSIAPKDETLRISLFCIIGAFVELAVLLISLYLTKQHGPTKPKINIVDDDGNQDEKPAMDTPVLANVTDIKQAKNDIGNPLPSKDDQKLIETGIPATLTVDQLINRFNPKERDVVLVVLSRNPESKITFSNVAKEAKRGYVTVKPIVEKLAEFGLIEDKNDILYRTDKLH